MTGDEMQTAARTIGPPTREAPSTGDLYTVTELGLAAFFMMHGIEMISCKWTANHYEVSFRNPNPENAEAGVAVFKRLQNKFINSDFSVFDMKIKELRKTARQR